MVASARITSLTQGAEFVEILREFIKNDKLFVELADEVKKLNALSDDETKTYHEAKILVQQRDNLKAEVEAIKAVSEKEKALHASKIEAATKEFNDFVTKGEADLAEKNAALVAREEAIAAEEIRLAQKENKLRETAAKMKGLIGE